MAEDISSVVPTPKEEIKVYPTTPDADGWYYDTKEQETMDIKTKVYDNGNLVKSLVLKDGRTAIIRQLKGWDMLNIKRFVQSDDKLDVETVTLSQACKLDGESYAPDYYLDMKMSDYSGLIAASAIVNFQ